MNININIILTVNSVNSETRYHLGSCLNANLHIQDAKYSINILGTMYHSRSLDRHRHSLFWRQSLMPS